MNQTKQNLPCPQYNFAPLIRSLSVCILAAFSVVQRRSSAIKKPIIQARIMGCHEVKYHISTNESLFAAEVFYQSVEQILRLNGHSTVLFPYQVR